MMGYDFSGDAKLTNEQLAGELAKLTPLTQTEIEKLLPKKQDKERLQKLVTIVNNSASQSSKLADLSKNFQELGGVVLKIVTKALKVI